MRRPPTPRRPQGLGGVGRVVGHPARTSRAMGGLSESNPWEPDGRVRQRTYPYQCQDPLVGKRSKSRGTSTKLPAFPTSRWAYGSGSRRCIPGRPTRLSISLSAVQFGDVGLSHRRCAFWHLTFSLSRRTKLSPIFGKAFFFRKWRTFYALGGGRQRTPVRLFGVGGLPSAAPTQVVTPA